MRRRPSTSPGAIRRLTVAVLVDGVRSTDANGVVQWTPRPEEELVALRELVASAVGFDEQRGDVITLRSLQFEPVAETVPQLERFIAEDVARNAELLRIANFQPE